MQAKLSADLRMSLLELAANNGGIVGVAAKTQAFGLDYQTLWNSMNRNKNPMFEDMARVVLVMLATGCFEPLRIIADYCGYQITPKPGSPADDYDLRHEAIELNHQAAGAGMRIETALEDGSIDDREDRDIRRSLQTVRNKIGKAESKLDDFRRRRGRG